MGDRDSIYGFVGERGISLLRRAAHRVGQGTPVPLLHRAQQLTRVQSGKRRSRNV